MEKDLKDGKCVLVSIKLRKSIVPLKFPKFLKYKKMSQNVWFHPNILEIVKENLGATYGQI